MEQTNEQVKNELTLKFEKQKEESKIKLEKLKQNADKAVEEIVLLAKSIKIEGNFSEYVNTREYELQITQIARSYVINTFIYKKLKDYVDAVYKNEKEISFSLYFILYTMCRRQNYGDFYSLARDYEENFSDFQIVKHIKLMAVIDKSSHSSTLYKAIKESKKMVENYLFKDHTGCLNVFTALVCKYFEYNLDERDESSNRELMYQALRCIKHAIEIDYDETKKDSTKQVYSKFYLNHGRILILLGQYNKGEDEIQKAIGLIEESNDRIAKVNEYNQYLLKASIIHSYDLNEEKNKDLEKIKVNNYKSIALMTTLLGFLLGAINIFTSTTDPFNLAMLMLCYSGLLLVLLGVVLFGLSLSMKDKKISEFIYTTILLIVGAAIFGFTLYNLINTKGMI